MAKVVAKPLLVHIIYILIYNKCILLVQHSYAYNNNVLLHQSSINYFSANRLWDKHLFVDVVVMIKNI